MAHNHPTELDAKLGELTGVCVVALRCGSIPSHKKLKLEDTVSAVWGKKKKEKLFLKSF